MPGYSVNWRHKAPKTESAKEPAFDRNITVTQLQPTQSKELNTIPTPAEKWTIPAPLKSVNAHHLKNITSTHIATNSTTTATVVNAPEKVDKGQPKFFTGDEQEDDHAKKSLVFGVLSLSIPAAAFLIMLGIILSVGGTLAKPATYAVVIFALGCAIGFVFAIFAIINGFIAINEINAAPDTYSGKGDAVLGIILALLVPIGLSTFLLLRSHK